MAAAADRDKTLKKIFMLLIRTDDKDREDSRVFEMKTYLELLQGFTNDRIVEGNKAETYKQIGNAVPAIFGEVLGNFISEHLNNFPKTSPVKLGVPNSFTG